MRVEIRPAEEAVAESRLTAVTRSAASTVAPRALCGVQIDAVGLQPVAGLNRRANARREAP
jgi:hypothetical protein